MESLLSRINNIVQESPGLVALAAPAFELTYAELLDRACRLSTGFARLGLGKSGVMVIAVDNPYQFAVCHLAAMCIGAATAPVSPRLNTTELSRRLAMLEPQLFVASRSITQVPIDAVARIPKVAMDGPGPGVTYIEELMNGNASSVSVAELSEDDVACIIFTSGMHAAPRAVRLSHENFAHEALQIGRALRIRHSDRVLCLHPLDSVFGIALGIHTPFASGAVVEMPQSDTNIQQLLQLQSRGVTLAFVPANQTNECASFPKDDSMSNGSTLRCVVSSGGRVKRDDLRAISDAVGAPVISSYGSSETTGVVTLDVLPDPESELAAGIPLSGLEIAIIDDSGKKLAVETRGRIAVRAPTVMLGYLGDPSARDDLVSSQDGWMITDDVGSIDYETQLTMYGHKSDCITRGGFPMQSWEVEDILAMHDAVSEVAVTGAADAQLGNDIRAWVVVREGASLSSTDLIEFAKLSLPVYKCPRVIRFVKELPHLPDGRINKGLLSDEKG